MSATEYYDPDEGFPVHSPLLKPCHPDLKPTSIPPWLPGGEVVDGFDLGTPWTPALLISGRPAAAYSERSYHPNLHARAESTDATLQDRILLDTMSGKDPNLRLPSQFDSWHPNGDDDSTDDNDLSLREMEPLIMDTVAPPLVVNGTQSDGASQQWKRHMAIKRWALPVNIQGRFGSVDVMTCPDSGSDDNVLSWSFVQSLGLSLSNEQHEKKDFSLANGKIIRSLGRVELPCNFASGSQLPTSLVTAFHVFQTLAVDVIMGMAFLEATRTFTEHRNRLVEIQIPQIQALRVQSVGIPRRHLLCRLDDHIVFANADSGSDIDLMSSSYAKSRFSIRSNKETIMFADGSTETTSGIAHLTLSVEDADSIATESALPSKTVSKEFHVFDNLTHDVLIGHETIELLRVFTDHDSALVPGIHFQDFSCLNVIRHLRKLNVPGLNKITESIRSLVRSKASVTTLSQIPDHDQWENARHSAELGRFEAMTDEAEAARLRHEETLRHNAYIASIPSPANTLPPLSPYPYHASTPATPPASPTARSGNSFRCTFEGCNAPPFQTQYLLK
ncbi:hypothetical protein CHU98_g11642 [Xylaria longipes]|nr:hypothetical protein CHU98_g11642 [Xylaria longipes]